MTEAAFTLPPFADPEKAMQRGAAALLPRKRMRPSEVAERYRMIVTGGSIGPWRNDDAPYLVEPMDCTASRDYEAVIFCGPARSYKTEGLILNVLTHRVICDPCLVHINHTSQQSARQFSREKWDQLNRSCEEVRLRLSPGRDDDNVFDKRYQQGMSVYLGWPTVDHVSSKDFQLVLDTEYDRKPDDIGGEGALFELERKRTQTFGSRGMTVVECSPSRDVLIEEAKKWRPRGHEAPPTTGILSLYNDGDRRWWYWPCPHCGEFFAASAQDLDWKKAPEGKAAIPIEEAVASVHLPCPTCGASIEENNKRAMNLSAQWLREGQTINGYGEISGEGRQSKFASFWLKGPAAAAQSWQSLVRNYLRAEEKRRRTGEINTLKAVINVDWCEPFWPPQTHDEAVLDAEVLKGRAEADWLLGTVPNGVRVLVITVDVQGRYFDVQVTGYGEELESWVVDRFQIAQSAEDKRLVNPGAYPEDWELLWPLLERGWPLAEDPTREMKALCMLVDSGGAPGVTGNAYRFAAAARKRGISDARLILLKGDSNVGAKRISLTKVDWTVKGRTMARGLHLLLISSNDMKDDVAGALGRETPGPGYVHTPTDLSEEWYDQVTAETKTDKGWQTAKSGARNEAFDHMCYARAAVIRPPWKMDRLNWQRVPSWAAPHEKNTLVRARAEAPIETAPSALSNADSEPKDSPRKSRALTGLGRLNAR